MQTEPDFKTYRMLIEYNGADFHGWQVQPGLPTIQAEIETALQTILRVPISVTGSGRTDAGVHARGQVAHFKTSETVDVYRLNRALNGVLPPGIAILEMEETTQGFHARYDAFRRRYHYYVSVGPRALDRHCRWYVRPAPDFEVMNKAATYLLGVHHFGSFCRTSSETENRVCRLERAQWVCEDRKGDWYFRIEANRFLHGMVRAIVGTLMQIGHRKRTADQLVGILKAKDRRVAGPAAPAHGLVLEEVVYQKTEP